ncbi:MAG: UDP-N-acetylmuramoyl-L-alanine--D-glutamate ligase [Candidatus Puniceispirillales bacterium]
MMIPKNMKDKTIGILGLGISGKSALKCLEAVGSRVFAYDDNTSSDLIVTNPNEWPWHELDQIIISPGIPLTHPLVKKAKKLKIQINNEIDIFARSLPKAKVIGVTGTNGKSTTTSLLGHIISFNGFKVQVGGNIGKAASSLTDPGKDGFIVLELSSFQLETCNNLILDGAIILNITPDHLEWHGNLNNYYNSKIKIASFLKKDAPLIISSNDNLCKKATTDLRDNHNVININEHNKINLSSIKSFVHFKENLIASFRILSFLGISENKSLIAVNTFKGLPHRMEFFLKKEKITFINDSKATNAEATLKALEYYKNIFWIVGGVSKSGGIEPSLNYLGNVRKCFLIGESKNEFFNTLNNKLECSISNTIEKALEEIFSETINLSEEITVLLSPAAASFDQFVNFEKRGQIFKKLVLKMWGT